MGHWSRLKDITPYISMTEQLPFDIMMNILNMRPADSEMRSPTAALIQARVRQIAHVMTQKLMLEFNFNDRDEQRCAAYIANDLVKTNFKRYFFSMRFPDR